MICVKIKAFLCFLKLVQLGPKKKEKIEKQTNQLSNNYNISSNCKYIYTTLTANIFSGTLISVCLALILTPFFLANIFNELNIFLTASSVPLITLYNDLTCIRD